MKDPFVFNTIHLLFKIHTKIQKEQRIPFSAYVSGNHYDESNISMIKIDETILKRLVITKFTKSTKDLAIMVKSIFKKCLSCKDHFQKVGLSVKERRKSLFKKKVLVRLLTGLNGARDV